MGSTRLPGKVMRPLSGKPMVERIIERLRAVPEIDDVVIATSSEPANDVIRAFGEKHAVAVFSGDENDVLDRYYQAARRFGADPVVRITADCPLIDPKVVSDLIALYRANDYDHAGVLTGASPARPGQGRFPDGLDAEVIRFAALKRAWREASAPGDREHVTPYLWRQPEKFRLGVLTAERDYGDMRWTVDNEEDFALIDKIFTALYPQKPDFAMADILAFLAEHPGLATINRQFINPEAHEKLRSVQP